MLDRVGAVVSLEEQHFALRSARLPQHPQPHALEAASGEPKVDLSDVVILALMFTETPTGADRRGSQYTRSALRVPPMAGS